MKTEIVEKTFQVGRQKVSISTRNTDITVEVNGLNVTATVLMTIKEVTNLYHALDEFFRERDEE